MFTELATGAEELIRQSSEPFWLISISSGSSAREHQNTSGREMDTALRLSRRNTLHTVHTLILQVCRPTSAGSFEEPLIAIWASL